MGLAADIATRIKHLWQEYTPQLISSRQSYSSLFANGNNLTATLQDLLRQCSYSDATTTGEWNAETATALSLFCKEADLSKNLSKQEYIHHLMIDKGKKSSDYLPAFVLIFSDPSNRLTMQQEERKKILEIINPVVAVQIILLDNPDKITFINTLKERANRNRIELIYYSGNDDKGNSIFQDGTFTLTDFAPLIAYQENIKLMVSNTCHSAYFAEAVTQVGVAGAMGAQEKITDDVGAQYGQLFFKWIIEGHPVEEFPDHFSRNRHSPISEGDFLFYKAGWFPKDSVIRWEKLQPDDSSAEVYSLVVGFKHDEKLIDSLTEKNMQLINSWLQDLPNKKENKRLIDTKFFPFVNVDIDQALIDLMEKAGQSTHVEKILIIYLAGKGMNHAVYPVFCLPRMTTEDKYSSINMQAYFSTLSNSGIFNQVIVWYDLQEESRTRSEGLSPEFGSPLPLRPGAGLLMGCFSEPVSKQSSAGQTAENNQGGLFTSKLLEGLNGKATTTTGDVTANSINNYIKSTVPGTTSARIGSNDFNIIKATHILSQKVMIRFTPDCMGKKFRLLDGSLQLIDEINVTNPTQEYELKQGDYVVQISETSLQKSFSVQLAPDAIEVNIGWKFLSKWICVIGSRYSLSKEKEATAQALGKFLADEGYGLITGGWPGIDYLIMEAYMNAIKNFSTEKDALKQIIVQDQEPGFQQGIIEKVSPNKWNSRIINNSFAILSIGGKKFTLRLFESARKSNFPFIPLSHTKGDSATIYNQLVRAKDSVLPKEYLKELGNYKTINERGFLDTLKAILDAVAGQTKSS